MLSPDKTVRTTCPYCGVGCQLSLSVKDGYIYRVDAPFDAAPNYGMLCVKGRFGTDYVKHPRRIKTPLIRTNRAEGRSAKPIWREADWDEALDYVADELVREGRERKENIDAFLLGIEHNRGKVIIFSTEFEPGHRLHGMGAIAALLRFNMEYSACLS